MTNLIISASEENNNKNHVMPIEGAGRLPRSDTARTAYETNEIRH
jgi:hypothetical protein